MKPLLSNELFKNKSNRPIKIIQFGEGNFLRAFVDWKIEQMNQIGFFNGNVAIVQPLRNGLEQLIQKQDCLYTVRLNGFQNGEKINTNEIITCVSSITNPYQNFQSFLDLANDDNARFIISNTTEAGIQFDATDEFSMDFPSTTFPGKLTQLLYHRFIQNKAGFILIPCELIEKNGEALKHAVLQYAASWKLGDEFINWIYNENTFCSSLVDQIVSGYPKIQEQELWDTFGYTDHLMVTAEPFHFWVIEGPSWIEDELPLRKANLNVIFTNDMTPYRNQKVHILNGSHTAMVPPAILANLETVEQVMQDKDLSQFINNLIHNEIIPTLQLPRNQLEHFARSTLERFKNPFIRHELKSIALNSVSKFKTRLLPILKNNIEQKLKSPEYTIFSLASLIFLYKSTSEVRQDDEQVIAVIEHAWQNPETLVHTLLSNSNLWGEDLSKLEGLEETLQTHINNIEQFGIREALQLLLAKTEV